MRMHSAGSLLLCFLLLVLCSARSNGQNGTGNVDIGVILDFDSYVGKMSKTSIELAVDDFYRAHQNYTTRLVLHFRDSRSDAVVAASAAIELLKNNKIKAILGPQKSSQADFISEIGNNTQVPIISFTATGPLVSHIEAPYFIRMAQPDTYQLHAIASVVKFFSWHQIVPIYELTNYGSGVITYLSDALGKVGTRVPYCCGISPSATDDQILKELYKLKTMQTRVFVVHMLPSLVSRLFLRANEAGMMSKGYVWIITDGITGLLETMDSIVIDSMQGVIGFKPYLGNSRDLGQFTERWKQKFSRENPEINRIQLSAFGLWAYDSVYALAQAVESVNGMVDSEFTKPILESNLTDLASIGIFQSGPQLLQSILDTNFIGLSGQFHLKKGQLPVSSFQIVNVVGNKTKEIGYWTRNGGITKQLNPNTQNTDDSGLQEVTWPGGSIQTPKGWEIPTAGNKLKVGVPVKRGFYQFIDVKRDPFTKAPIVTGYCIDVFEAVMKAMPFEVPFEYVPFETDEGSGQSKGNYDDLISEVGKGVYNYDVAVGDITILANRSLYADFTLPYTESEVSMIVPVKGDDRKKAWIFTRPLEAELWITIGVFFVYTGIVIWILEHRVNKKFRGTPRKQIGMIFWFSFSTLVFAHREKVISNLTRFVLIVWIFVVLVLSSSYTASLTSLLTVQQLQPTATAISDLIKRGSFIGYQEGSFTYGRLKEYADESKLRVLRTSEDYIEALSNGSVSAVVDELPYLRLVLSTNCSSSKFTMVGLTNRTAGFGFAFPKGSPLVPEVSRAILNVTESEKMVEITKLWFRSDSECLEQDRTNLVSNSLGVDSFKGLFLIALMSSTTALAIFLVQFLHENRETLTSRAPLSQKLTAIAKAFYMEKEGAGDTEMEEKEQQQETETRDFSDVPQGFTYGITDFSPGDITLSQHEKRDAFTRRRSFFHRAGTPYHDVASTSASEDRQ